MQRIIDNVENEESGKASPTTPVGAASHSTVQPGGRVVGQVTPSTMS
jgi:hypothetical protein